MTNPASPVAVVLMAYGTPASFAEIPEYYTDIRRGRPPSSDQLAELERRYQAIGGLSPLRQRTEDQRSALHAALEALSPGRYSVTLGYKHVVPSIEDAARAALDGAIADDADASTAEVSPRVVGVVLAPHFSSGSVGVYLQRLDAVLPPGRGRHVTSWATLPAFVHFLAAEVRAGLAALPAGSEVAFTAHSLPQRLIDGGDPYVGEVTATATAIADLAELGPGTWQVAWQSAGRTPEAWLGPDIGAVLEDAADRGAPGVLVCACGFVADHLEVLYDLDIEARGHADRLGIAFARTANVNDDPEVLAGLAALVHQLAVGP